MTLYDFPILKQLNVPPQTAYDLISLGVESMRIQYQTSRCLGDEKKTFELYDKIQQGERLLWFIRVNTLPG